jgi:tetratricopeptide (TPR) repeat protein
MRLLVLLSMILLPLIADNDIGNSCDEFKKLSDDLAGRFNKKIEHDCLVNGKVSFSHMIQFLDMVLEEKNKKILKRFSTILFREYDIEKILTNVILGHYFELGGYFLKEFKSFQLDRVVYPPYKKRLLHIATQNNDLKAVKFLLKHHADTNVKDIFKFKPSFYITSKKMERLYKEFHIKIPSMIQCSTLMEEERIDEAIGYCLQKAQLSEKANYFTSASWYYLLAKKPLLSKKFSLKTISDTSFQYIGYMNLGHYYILAKEYDKAKKSYKKLLKSFDSSDRELRRAFLEDFTILRKIYKDEFDIYRAYDIMHEIL